MGRRPPEVPPVMAELGGAGSQEVPGVEPTERTRPVQAQAWLGGAGSTQQDGARLWAVLVEGSSQGQWWPFLQPSASSHIVQSLPLCLWCLLSHCSSAGVTVSAREQAL